MRYVCVCVYRWVCVPRCFLPFGRKRKEDERVSSSHVFRHPKRHTGACTLVVSRVIGKLSTSFKMTERFFHPHAHEKPKTRQQKEGGRSEVKDTRSSTRSLQGGALISHLSSRCFLPVVYVSSSTRAWQSLARRLKTTANVCQLYLFPSYLRFFFCLIFVCVCVCSCWAPYASERRTERGK